MCKPPHLPRPRCTRFSTQVYHDVVQISYVRINQLLQSFTLDTGNSGSLPLCVFPPLYYLNTCKTVVKGKAPLHTKLIPLWISYLNCHTFYGKQRSVGLFPYLCNALEVLPKLEIKNVNSTGFIITPFYPRIYVYISLLFAFITAFVHVIWLLLLLLLAPEAIRANELVAYEGALARYPQHV